MKKETYLKKADKLRLQIAGIKAELVALRKDYIEKNKEFDVDDLVQITTPKQTIKAKGKVNHIAESTRLAFINGFDVRSDGSIRYKLLMCKPDGSKAKTTDYHHYNETIKKVEQNEKR